MHLYLQPYTVVTAHLVQLAGGVATSAHCITRRWSEQAAYVSPWQECDNMASIPLVGKLFIEMLQQLHSYPWATLSAA